MLPELCILSGIRSHHLPPLDGDVAMHSHCGAKMEVVRVEEQQIPSLHIFSGSSFQISTTLKTLPLAILLHYSSVTVNLCPLVLESSTLCERLCFSLLMFGGPPQRVFCATKGE